jgi:predicted O-methyltransferase YrrM
MNPMQHIRPHKLFNLLPGGIEDRLATVKIPFRTENYLLETFLLLAAAKLVNAKRVFEFGTFKGATTLNLALNLPGAEIFTFDLAPCLAGSVKQDYYHAAISRQHFEQQTMEFDRVQHGAQIHRIEDESLRFDSSPYHGSMDLVFVDGGHDRATLDADTRNAFLMAPHGCVAWHDYGNPEYPDVKPT